MKSLSALRSHSTTSFPLLAVLLLLGVSITGCAATAAPVQRKVIFEGIGLERSNGELVVLQSPHVDAALRAALNLTDAEVALLARVPHPEKFPGPLGGKRCLTTSNGGCIGAG